MEVLFENTSEDGTVTKLKIKKTKDNSLSFSTEIENSEEICFFIKQNTLKDFIGILLHFQSKLRK